MIIKCTRCGIEKEVTPLKRYFRDGTLMRGGANSVYIDSNGKKSCNNVCYECFTKLRRARQEIIKIKKREARILKIESERKSKELLKKITCVSCDNSYAVSFVKWFFHKGRPFHPVYNQIGEDQKTQFSEQKSFVSNKCFECRQNSLRKNQGRVRRGDSTKPQTVAAVGAEKIAQKRFEDLGFSVKRVEVIGPDLTCKLGDWTYTVEVKRATYKGRSWKVAHVRPNRKKDDLIAMVLPNGYVYIDSMENHLSKCTKYGSRAISGIVKEFGLTPLPTT